MRKPPYLLCFYLLVSVALSAQVFPSAERSGATVWVGAEISTFNPDYACKENSPFACLHGQLLGIAPFVDADHMLFQRLGAEGQARFLHWRGPGQGITQSSYLAGPLIALVQFKSTLSLRGKFLFGLANINLPPGCWACHPA
jgi:hypothetical protein